ncbi:phosphatidylserine decarboxylase [Candidatus Woesearchaeota archaeon]|nr:phosphatidylserine decarboxylase [Candidatus Woesearchaeota archaeon]
MGWILKAIIVLALLLILFLLNFYRDPKRAVPKGYNIVAPSDGRVISIIDTSKNSIEVKKGLLGKIKTLTKDIAKECYVVSIFMSPFDVHINRAPIEGVIRSVKHTKGSFFKAYDLEKSLQNEKNEIIIQNGNLRIKVIQIAGFLARRIKCYVKPNQKVNKGSKIGMIALSSQTTIVIPKWVGLKAKTGQHMKAGSTIIAGIKN